MADVVSSPGGVGRLPGLVPVSGLLLGIFAYRALFLDAPHLSASADFEQWFFRSERGSPLLPLAIAVWMLVRRRDRLRSLPDRSATALASVLVAVGVCLFAWASLTGARALLPLSLAANLLSLAMAAKGVPGLRVALLPALVLLLGVPLPAPLRDPITWQLQLSSARAAAWLLQAAGLEIALGGVVIHSGDHAFTVIESCSGLRGIQILTLVALAARELNAAAGWRSWLVVAAAPCLATALNVLRIAVVVALTGGADAAAQDLEGWDHTPQGLAVLAAGTLALYLLARALAGASPPGARGSEAREDANEGDGPAPRRALRAVALAVLGLLALLSLAPAPLARLTSLPEIALPRERSGWVGEDLPLDRLFVGQFLPGQVLHRRYRMERSGLPPRIVEILVGVDDGTNPASRLFSPKLLLPDHDWSVAESRPARLWLLGIDGRLVVAERDSELALGYLWRLRDEGPWREAWRAAFELELGPLRRERPRAVVRLLTPLASDEAVARDRAKRTLDLFVRDFRAQLADL